jgi:hypothetical protein
MKFLSAMHHTLRFGCVFLGLILLYPEKSSAEINEKTVEIIVKNSNCLPGKTIEDALKEKIKSHSQRDLGWLVFNEDGQFEVERAFLMNKSMQLRFRWRVNPDGVVKPVSSRAESLCDPDSTE